MVPTFHPAAILRGGGESSRQFLEFRDDFELVRETLATLNREPDSVTAAEATTLGPIAAEATTSGPIGAEAPTSDPVIVPEPEPVPEEQLELF